MKIPMLGGTSTSSETAESDRVEEAVIEAIKESNNKTVEIRPANESKGWGISRLLLFVGAVVALGYWTRKSQKPKEIFQSAKSETANRTKAMSEQAADRTKEMSEQTAETIQEGGETVAERIEEGSEEAGEQIEQTGEEAAEATEEAGEEAAEKADEDESN